MGFLEGSPWPKIAALCLVIALLTYLVSFGAPNWAETNPDNVQKRSYFGLWRHCTSAFNGPQDCDDFINYTSSGDFSVFLCYSEFAAIIVF